MVRTKHQQKNHQQCHKLGARFSRYTRVVSTLVERPRSERFMLLVQQAIKMHIFSPYKAPKNYAARRV